MTPDWSLDIARRSRARRVFTDTWMVEKLAAIGQALAWASELSEGLGRLNYTVETALDLHDALYEAYRSTCKVALWIAGHSQDYDEEATRRAFVASEKTRLDYLEYLLGPILEWTDADVPK